MAVKILDGIFIGNSEMSTDFDFLNANKITTFINTAGNELSNLYQTKGFIYTTLYWEDEENFILFDENKELIGIEVIVNSITFALRYYII